ncbi:MAG TPA: type II toxin-antitoxin system VapC family toxin [Oceanipulchritudo sp.]|nr:type II toxin-antitoxin system VapC family toxin [Oceanipulchritudo sp.]
MIYADSSFLVSLYFRDANSKAARREMETRPQEIALSRIAGLEVKNAFRLAVFREWITPGQAERVQALFDTDSSGGFLRPIPFTADEVFAEAERLSQAHTALSGNRSLDVLHVACARLTKLKVFATFDERQRKLAQKVGLQVTPIHHAST